MKRHILYSLYIAVLLALLYFDKVLTFVMNIICKLTHPIQCSGIVLCAIGTVVVIAIEILRRKYPIVHKSKKTESMAHPLFSDQPTTDDKFDRTISAEILIEKIFSTFHAKQAVNGSFVVNTIHLACYSSPLAFSVAKIHTSKTAKWLSKTSSNDICLDSINDVPYIIVADIWTCGQTHTDFE